ncbi:hypothetical protein EXIGLDRAFT_769681 [Exidia glandulosa HHB12029]|uniref:DUF6532 domain-containing protein n=1 Tax=Exidia glandulosa HHB12029 TaxID=1314781 RepID=A0A165H976_EXIGL|nr:hypothetical protein EXIGLDRAFT_769681 [Exidia glandulosa HHB12029]
MRKKKQADTATTVPTLDIATMTEDERAALLAALNKEQKRRQAAAKKAKNRNEAQAVQDAERLYQEEQVAQGRTAARSAASRRSNDTLPMSILPDDDQHAQSTSEPGSDGFATSPAQSEVEDVDEVSSPAGYESGDDNLGTRKRHRPVRQVTSEDRATKKARASDADLETETFIRRRGAGAANLMLGDPRMLNKTLAKGPDHSKRAAAATTVVVRRPATPATASPDASSNSGESDVDSLGEGPHTPYKPVRNNKSQKRPVIEEFSPKSREMADFCRTAMCSWIANSDAFPTEGIALDKASDLARDYMHKSEDPKIERRGFRWTMTPSFRTDMKWGIKNVDARFRGDVVKDVGPIIEAALGVLDPEKCPDKEARIDHIAMLLQDAAFMFREPETRTDPLRHRVIPQMISKAFLLKKGKNGHALGLGTYVKDFSEVSNELIAFLLTIIECMLLRWKSGEFVQVDFTRERFHGKYHDHLESLLAFEENGYLDTVRKEIWTEACKLAGISPGIEVHDDAEVVRGNVRRGDLEKLAAARAQGSTPSQGSSRHPQTEAPS